jgi:hypothetical protein
MDIYYSNSQHSIHIEVTGRKGIYASVGCLRRSKRFGTHYDVLGLATRWMAEHGMTDSIPVMDRKDFELFATFPETFSEEGTMMKGAHGLET